MRLLKAVLVRRIYLGQSQCMNNVIDCTQHDRYLNALSLMLVVPGYYLTMLF